MRNFILLAILTLLLFSCGEKTKSGSTNQNPNTENLTPGPIVQESLNKEQLEKVKIIYETFKEVYPVSLEETITNFKRDQNPNNEISIWLKMAETYEFFARENTGEERFEARKEAFKLILMRSMMSEKEAVSSAEIKILDNDEIQQIFKNYKLEAKPIKVEKK